MSTMILATKKGDKVSRLAIGPHGDEPDESRAREGVRPWVRHDQPVMSRTGNGERPKTGPVTIHAKDPRRWTRGKDPRRWMQLSSYPHNSRKHLNNSLSQHQQRERAHEGVAVVYNEDIDININKSLTRA